MERISNKTNRRAFSLRALILGFLPVLGICILPSLYLFAQNALLCPLTNVLGFMGITIGVGVVCYLVFYLLFRRRADAAALMGVICMTLFSYFYLLCDLTKKLSGEDRSLYAFLIVCVIVAIAFVLVLKSKDMLLRIVRIALTVFLCAMLLMNVVTAVPGTFKRLQLDNIDAIPVVDTTELAYQPDIYYLIFDEYAVPSTIETYFLADSTHVVRYLEERGFSLSDKSYNATNRTRWNLTNNLCLSDDVVNIETDQEIVIAKGASARIYSILAKIGYRMFALESIKGVFNCKTLNHFDDMGVRSITLAGKTPFKLLFESSMLRPFAWLVPNYEYEGTIASTIMDYLSDDDNFTASGNTVLFCHVLSPHQPFAFHADGTLRPHNTWDTFDVSHYFEQHQYVSGRICEIADTILSKDPDSVIIIQSDHNFRVGDAGLLPNGQPIPYAEQCRIFNAVYFRGEPIDIEGLSGPETLRLVLEKLGATIE